MKNYYQILGVDKNATVGQIKKAYRKLSMEWHPDRNLDKDTSEKFKEIKEAYESLSDAKSRRQYDTTRDFKFNQYSGAPEFDINEFFKKSGFAYREAPKAKKRYTVSISLKEAYTGTTIEFQGMSIRIPAGIRSGNIFMHGQDIIQVNVAPHFKFKRAENDLLVDVNIDAFEAMLGTDAILDHLDGSRLKFKIPSGTQHLQVIKLSGKGMMNVENSRYGDCLIRCNIIIPQNLTVVQKNAILSVYSKKPIII